MSKTFVTTTRTRFRQADPAGILFFAETYAIVHDAYEDFVTHLGIEWKNWFENPEWAVPIRHSSCEHLSPMVPSQDLNVHVMVNRLGESSFTLKYAIEREQRTYAEVTLVHAFIDKKSRTKTAIPSDIRARLEAYSIRTGGTGIKAGSLESHRGQGTNA
jgi:acyl-CoA thioester hydrolase/1,4-dihydroxy-2-naphthoyl-CoA hydrolase